MANVKITIFVMFQPSNSESLLLAVNQLSYEFNVELIFIASNKFANLPDKLMNLSVKYKLLFWKEREDWAQSLNEVLLDSHGEYITLIAEDEIPDVTGFKKLIHEADKHQSDIAMGSFEYNDILMKLYIKHPLFKYEKLKKYFYNTSLENEPALALLLHAGGNKIFRSTFVKKSGPPIREADLTSSYKPFFLQNLLLTKKITYLPYRTCLIQSGNTTINSITNFLTVSHELRKQIFSKTILQYYETGLLLELSNQLYSQDFIQMSEIDQLGLLSKIDKKTEIYTSHLFKSLFPKFRIFVDLLHSHLYWECIEYLNIVLDKEMSDMRVAKYRKEYNSLKKEIWKPVIKLNNMLKRLGG